MKRWWLLNRIYHKDFTIYPGSPVAEGSPSAGQLFHIHLKYGMLEKDTFYVPRENLNGKDVTRCAQQYLHGLKL